MNLNLPTLEDIRSAYREGEEAVVALFLQVQGQVAFLAGQVATQAEAIHALEAALGQDSRTSSKPPSSDGYGKAPVDGKRTESLRKAGQKPNGGQPGHEGKTLQQTADPDHAETYAPEACQQCGTSLTGVAASGQEERQVFDIPAMRIEVTAHRVLHVACPACGALNQADFPDGVNAPVQYGSGIKAVGSYLTCGHHLPLARTTEILEDLFGQPVSEAVVSSAVAALSEAVRPAEAATKALLTNSAILHADESGLRVAGKLHWVHVAATDKLTHYSVHAKRGKEATGAADILPRFSGTAVHDHWKPYFSYDGCSHALCNAHHLRELEAVEKLWLQPWAGRFAQLLCEIKEATEEAKGQGAECLPDALKARFNQRYAQLLEDGYAANPLPPPNPDDAGKAKKRGRGAQSPPRNLLDRLATFKPQVLAFMDDFRVPFDNNQAERDIRMVKLKQKVSGCFRTVGGAESFARIRGYLSTARKNGNGILAAIMDAAAGNPFIPSPA